MVAPTSDSARGEENRPRLKEPSALQEIALKPRLKLFFSADIVGSTAFKQSFRLAPDNPDIMKASVHERRRWQRTIEDFYDLIKDRFPVIWGSRADKLRGEPDLHALLAGRAPRFWKTVGDEVLFWKELTHEAQLWIVLISWLECIAELRPMLRNYGLDVKSSIWIAEFPVRNCALVTRNDERKTAQQSLVAGVRDPIGLKSVKPGDAGLIDDNHQLMGLYYDNPYNNAGDADFIGPGIDVGFRISEFASQRRLALSVDVAYLLALSRINLFGTTKDDTNHDANGLAGYAQVVNAHLGNLRDYVKALAIPEEFSCGWATDRKRIAFKDLQIHFSGAEPLKGVLGGIKYPRFWMSIVEKGSYEDAKQDMYLRDMAREGPTWGQLFRYCQAFYTERSHFIRPPVILGKTANDRSACIAWSSTCDEASYDLYIKAYGFATTPDDEAA